MLYYVVSTIFVIDCFVLVLVILLQQGKGGDIASAFGGGASQAVFGARSGATVLSRATSVCAALFIICARALAASTCRAATAWPTIRTCSSP
jgi:preprotein translocase subunit SecG